MIHYLLRKSNVFFVAFIHFVLVCKGIVTLTEELGITYEDYTLEIVILYYLLHFFLITTLVISVYKNQHILMLPWLVSACMVIILATVKSILAIDTLDKGLQYYMLNFLIIGAYWFAWFIVFTYFQDLIKVNRDVIGMSSPVTLRPKSIV